jgi:anti-sigma factor RsiW
MYDCKKIKDLILTDYVDSQLDNSIKGQVEAHLSQCESCRSFAQEVESHLVVPFEKAQLQEVPSEVWESIKQKVSQESQPQGIKDLIQGWIEGFNFPRFVPAVASFVMFVCISSAVLLNWQTKQAQIQEQGSYVEFMLSSAASNAKDSYDLGTPIEQYFL